MPGRRGSTQAVGLPPGAPSFTWSLQRSAAAATDRQELIIFYSLVPAACATPRECRVPGFTIGNSETWTDGSPVTTASTRLPTNY
jgi:hypothetical protein